MALQISYENGITGEKIDITGAWSDGAEFQQELQGALHKVARAQANGADLTSGRLHVALTSLVEAEEHAAAAFREVIQIAEDEGFTKTKIADILGISTAKLKNLTQD